MFKYISCFLFLIIPLCALNFEKREYEFKDDPIDVIIPCHPKDLSTLDRCIRGIKHHGKNVRRIVVISAERLTKNAEWFDEAKFPFTKRDIAREALRSTIQRSPTYSGWLYQQVLKFYAPYVIPGLSSNILILDSDTIFLNHTSFTDAKGAALFNPGVEYNPPYFEHINQFLPGLKKVFKNHSGISHCMLFQKSVLDALFAIVETYHKKPFWKAFCNSIPPKNRKLPSASEFEIYFNFAFTTSDQFDLRKLKWTNVSSINRLSTYQKNKYNFVSAHAYMRER